MPLAVLTMLSVMENMNRNLPRAALTLGARPGTAFWKIYFPLALPGVAAASIMVFVTAIGFFITPALLGGRHETMITQLIIVQIQQTLNWGFAGAISVLLLLVVLVVFGIYDRVLGLSTMTGASASTTTTGRPGYLHRAGQALLDVLARGSDWLLGLCPKFLRKREETDPSTVMCWFVLFVLVFLSLTVFLNIPPSFGAAFGLRWHLSGCYGPLSNQ